MLEDDYRAIAKSEWHRGYRAARKRLMKVIGLHLSEALILQKGISHDQVKRMVNAIRCAPIVYPQPHNPYSLGSGGDKPSDRLQTPECQPPPVGAQPPVDRRMED